MDDGCLYFASIIFVPFLEEEASGSWNRGYELVIQQRLRPPTVAVFFLEILSNFQTVCYDRLFLFGGELCFDLVWDNDDTNLLTVTNYGSNLNNRNEKG